MKRLVCIISSFLMFAGIYGEGVGAGDVLWIADQDKAEYLNWVAKLEQGDAEGKCWGGECRAVLAVGPSGCWAKFPDMSLSRAKKEALKKCNTDCNTNECQIMDVDGQSDFIKQKGSSASSSTSPSGASSTSSNSAPDPDIELEFWRLVKDSNELDLLHAYLDEYPNGKFVPLAKIKIKKLGGTLKDGNSTAKKLGAASTNVNSPATNLSSLLGTYKGKYIQLGATKREMFIDFFRDVRGNLVGRWRQPHVSWEEQLTEIRVISIPEWVTTKLPASRCGLERHCVKATWANSQGKGTYWFQFTLDYVSFEGIWGTPGDPPRRMSGTKIATE